MCDPTSQEVPTNIVADNSVDIAVMVFFLSAVDPDKMDAVLSHVSFIVFNLLIFNAFDFLIFFFC